MLLTDKKRRWGIRGLVPERGDGILNISREAEIVEAREPSQVGSRVAEGGGGRVVGVHRSKCTRSLMIDYRRKEKTGGRTYSCASITRTSRRQERAATAGAIKNKMKLHLSHNTFSTMPLLKIIQYGHPLLRKVAKEVTDFAQRERDLILSMAETMYANRGVGLAATQVGVMQRIFVADSDQDRDSENGGSENRRLRVFINPQVTWESEEDDSMEEGCLSIPEIRGEVFRPAKIKVVARDENFEPFELDAEALLSRVIQHELDHLNGVLFIDKLPMLKRPLIAAQLMRLKKQTVSELPQFSGNYPVYL